MFNHLFQIWYEKLLLDHKTKIQWNNKVQSSLWGECHHTLFWVNTPKLCVTLWERVKFDANLNWKHNSPVNLPVFTQTTTIHRLKNYTQGKSYFYQYKYKLQYLDSNEKKKKLKIIWWVYMVFLALESVSEPNHSMVCPSSSSRPRN